MIMTCNEARVIETIMPANQEVLLLGANSLAV